ncbi:hypothetical protein BC834DRAFT_906717 [Gloeopeniophorella convolvens]|nr:hypothetical protein BC834DRAFT_906717 [Gloeopeniophorella convolvens]
MASGGTGYGDGHLADVLWFRTTKEISEHPERVRDALASASLGSKPEHAYWGQSIESPTLFVWILVWDTPTPPDTAESALPALAAPLCAPDGQPTRWRVRFPSHVPPYAPLIASVTEFATSESDQIEVLQRLSQAVLVAIDATTFEGYRGRARGVALHDPGSVVYLAGWDSIEAHMKVGTEDGHQAVVKAAEELFQHFRDFQMHHMQLQRVVWPQP